MPVLPAPPKSATDIALAVIGIALIVLDVLNSYGWGPQLTAQQHEDLLRYLTILAIAVGGFYTANRGIKHVTQAKILSAATASAQQATTPSSAAPPDLPTPFTIPHSD